MNGLSYVVICDDDGTPVLNTLSDNASLPKPNNLNQLGSGIASGTIHVRNPILLSYQKIGLLQFGLSVKNFPDATVKEKRNSLIRIFFILAFTLLIIFIFGRRFSKHISDRTHASQEITSGKFQKVMVVTGRDELSVLKEHFNLMTFQVNRKFRKLPS